MACNMKWQDVYKEDHNICVVGDIDQNIYSWRGATIKNILGFEKDFPGAEMIVLEQNYRSTGNILKAANAIIEKNINRREKNLFTENEEGEKITTYNAFDGLDEARFVADEIQKLIAKGISANEIAILYRANFQSRILEESLLRLQLPYQVLGTKFFDRKEVKDVLSFLRASLNPDDLTSFSRIINSSKRNRKSNSSENIGRK
jgi:DNA helicase-2/ATP-dependent DNA helicase PcrA